MSALGVESWRHRLAKARAEAVAWGRTEGWNWIFVFKTTLAALLAMLISMRLELDQPRTAMITVFVVMQPHTGLVLEKSLYRIAGTLAGTAASLLLVALFAQQPELFLVGLALWIGLCTAGAAFYRNFKSYGFVLAGYTAAMIGLPSALQPGAFFGIATTRLSEVVLGILCAGVLSDTIFPRRLSDAITGNVRSRYRDFIAFVHASISGAAESGELEAMRLRLVGQVISLESVRSAAVLEDPEVRLRDFKLRKLNSEFMAACTTFHSFHQLLKRLTREETPAGRALSELYESLRETLLQVGEAPGSAQAARQTARRIAAFRLLLSQRVERIRNASPGLAADPRAALDFETAVELLSRFVRELHAYTGTYARLPEKEPEPGRADDIRFALRNDPLVALLSGARAFAAILLVGAFWIVTAWPQGISAVLNAGIVSALFATTPNPPRAAGQMTFGFSCGFLAALMVKFLVVPHLDGYLLLSACLAPVLLLGASLASRPNLFGIGMGCMIFFTYTMAPANSMQFDPVGSVNEGIATIIGVATAGVMSNILFPATGAWFERRLTRQLRRQVSMACARPLVGLAHRFESGTHDLLHRMAMVRQARSAQEGRAPEWMFPVLEVGRAVIHLRQDAEAMAVPQRCSRAIRESLGSTARLFGRPSLRRRDEALERVEKAINALAGERVDGMERSSIELRRRLLASLHLIRTALLDEELTILGERNHAA